MMSKVKSRKQTVIIHKGFVVIYELYETYDTAYLIFSLLSLIQADKESFVNITRSASYKET